MTPRLALLFLALVALAVVTQAYKKRTKEERKEHLRKLMDRDLAKRIPVYMVLPCGTTCLKVIFQQRYDEDCEREKCRYLVWVTKVGDKKPMGPFATTWGRDGSYKLRSPEVKLSSGTTYRVRACRVNKDNVPYYNSVSGKKMCDSRLAKTN